MKKSLLFLLAIIICLSVSAESYANWAVSIRKYPNSIVQSIKKCNDGNYILLSSHHGSSWVIKMDIYGEIIWQKAYRTLDEYGEQNTDYPDSIEQTLDGGFIIVGNTNRNRTYVIKIDSIGNLEWKKIGNYHSFYVGDFGTGIKQADDGSYFIADQPSEFGADDFGLMKLNSDGSFAWRAAYGANDWQHIQAIAATPDGGFILSGDEGYSGDRNLWIVKVKSDGVVQWQKRYLSDNLESGDHHAIVKTTLDGGFIVAGGTTTTGSNGNDAWILKLDENGNIIWQNRYYSTTAGSWQEHIFDIEQTSDGGYVFVGRTDDLNGQRSSKIWLVKLDHNGLIDWDRVYYGGGIIAHSIDLADDGGYIIGGGRKHPDTTVYIDNLIMKVNANGEIPGCSLYMEEGTYAAEINGVAEETQFSQKIITALSVIDVDVDSETTVANSYFICEISNNPPVANAGDDVVITSQEISDTVIYGTASDIDIFDQLEYRWLNNGAILQNWFPVTETGECLLYLSQIPLELGTYLLSLEVSDGQKNSIDEMNLVIGNTAPEIAPSGGGVYDLGSSVLLMLAYQILMVI